MKVVGLQNGLRLTTSNGGIEEIIALREDVLRVRVAKGPVLPEDASWAVLPQTKQRSVVVKQQSDATTVGFNTQKLQVAVSRSDLRLTVRDAQGRILQQDAAAIAF